MHNSIKIVFLVLVGIAFLIGSSDAVAPDVSGMSVESLPSGDGVKILWTAVAPYSSGCWGKTEDPLYAVYLDDELIADSLTEPEYDLKTYGHEIQVTVFWGESESPGDEISVAPISITTLVVWELNGYAASGMGWNTISGYAATYSMASDANKDNIDCYFTNFVFGFDGIYHLASPSKLKNDKGHSLPTKGWKTSLISGALGDFDTITIVPPDNGNYNSAAPVAVNQTYAVKTQDGYYGLIQVMTMDTTNGEIEIKTTFQPIKGLRWM